LIHPIDKAVIIIGAGGHAKILAEALMQSGRKVLGFTTPDKGVDSEMLGLSILGDDSALNKYSLDDVDLVNGMGTLPNQNLRQKLAEKMRQSGYSFSAVVHPTAIVGSDVILEEGVQIMAGAIVQPGAKIGRDTIINTGSIVDHDCEIAEDCHIAPGVTLSGGVKIGSGVHVGTGTTIIQNISVGSNSVIAAGSILYKNVPNDVTYIQPRQLTIKE